MLCSRSLGVFIALKLTIIINSLVIGVNEIPEKVQLGIQCWILLGYTNDINEYLQFLSQMNRLFSTAVEYFIDNDFITKIHFKSCRNIGGPVETVRLSGIEMYFGALLEVVVRWPS